MSSDSTDFFPRGPKRGILHQGRQIRGNFKGILFYNKQKKSKGGRLCRPNDQAGKIISRVKRVKGDWNLFASFR